MLLKFIIIFVFIHNVAFVYFSGKFETIIKMLEKNVLFLFNFRVNNFLIFVINQSPFLTSQKVIEFTKNCLTLQFNY